MVAVATAQPAAPLVTRFKLLDNSPASSEEEEAPARAARLARKRCLKVLDDSSSSSEDEAPALAARQLPAHLIEELFRQVPSDKSFNPLSVCEVA